MKKLKYIITAILLTMVVGSLLAQTASAYSVGEFGKDVGGWLSGGGKQGLSFSEYQDMDMGLTTDGFDSSLTESTDAKEFIIRIVNFGLGFLGLIAVIMVIYGGVLYVTSGGEQEKTESGKKNITYAAVGLLIVMGSFAFVNTIIAGGAGQEGGGGSTGMAFKGNGFNASAEQVRAIAQAISGGFIFTAEAYEELENVKNDISKESLTPEELPSKSDMMSFLQTYKLKLSNLETRVTPFTTAHTTIQTQIREVENHIDKIDSISTAADWLDLGDGEEKVCNSKGEVEDMTLGEGLSSGWDKDSRADDCKTEGYDKFYAVGLYKAWFPIHEKYTTAGTSTAPNAFDTIMAAISNEYATKLSTVYILGLDELFNSVSNYDAIKNGDAKTSFDSMQKEYAALVGNLASWTTLAGVSTNIEVGADILGRGLTHNLDLYEALMTLQFVDARLNANVINGSAPLTVIFTVDGSVDPAGGTILTDKIIWDLGGTYKTSDLLGATTSVSNGTGFECTVQIPVTTEDEEFLGTTTKRCIFDRPGTYNAQIKINSKEGSTYAPGISTLQIKVNPPTTKIELTARPAGSTVTPTKVMHYNADGVVEDDMNEITFTETEAKSGIIFDATGTDAVTYSWNFGDGTSQNPTSSETTKPHKYQELGKYEVVLEVVNELGIVDKKIFTINITTISAKITASPTKNVFINTPVTFDGSGSRADTGKIKNYEWIITKSPGYIIDPKLKDTDLTLYTKLDTFSDIKSGANLSSIAYEFEYAINYDIKLVVTDENSPAKTASAEIKNFKVQSQPPVAIFDYTFPKKTQPGTAYLDASRSFDPDDERADLNYSWSIDPATGWDCISAQCARGGLPFIKDPIIKFTEPGVYKVTLTVEDQINDKEYDDQTNEIIVNNVLDIAWGATPQDTGQLDAEGKAEIAFEIVSESSKVSDYEIDFGDGETESGKTTGTVTVKHTYTQAGKFNVEAFVFDDDNNDNSIKKKVYVSSSGTPIARIDVLVNGVKILNPYLSEDDETFEGIIVTRPDVITFDASNSKNMDGTGKKLSYSWNFGDTGKSSNKTATHSYDEISPKDPGYFEVTLVAFDQDDPSKKAEDTIRVRVDSVDPTFSSIKAVPDSSSSDMVTPVTVNLKVYGAKDEDGEVVKYKWWYYDVDDTTEKLGVQVTEVPTAKIQIGTNGKEGREIEYEFGMEITDIDGKTVSSVDILHPDLIPSVEVINGPNKAPVAKFSVDSTSIFTGEKVTFTSSSSDADGSIVSYVWDFEGDGFFNNEATEESSVIHTFEQRNKNGYDVRLKVIDNDGGEATSEPKKIYVDSLAEPPVAAFKYELVDGSQGKKVKFKNNSTADTKAGAEIIDYKWDFDTASMLETADSDGDGKKDNDIDSQVKDPDRLFMQYGAYKVKLTVTDNQGNEDEVIKEIKIPLADPPKAAFTFVVDDNKVTFKNNSSADATNGAVIEKYIWDFDTDSEMTTADSDGDGDKANDEDSTKQSPVKEFAYPGEYNIKLTVVDNQGGEDDVINKVSVGSKISDLPLPGTIGNTGNTGMGIPPQNTTNSNLQAIVSTNPPAAADGTVYLSGTSGSVTFDFSKSKGQIAHYIIDKNILFDTDGNGLPDDELDFKTLLAGTWTTNFEKSWGKVIVQLKVVDIYGNESKTTKEIKFQ